MPKHSVHYSLATALEAVRADKDSVVEMDRWAEIGDSGASELAGTLRKNENLEILILGSQNIGPLGAQAIGEAMHRHMKLKELHLHNNKLGYEGVEKLAHELAKPLSKSSSKPGNKILQVLVLRKNEIGPHCSGLCGMCRFSPQFPIALLDLTSLQLIDMNNNELVYLPLEIANMPKLIGLDLRNNSIDNIPDQVMVTARSGHQSGFLILKEWMLAEIQRLDDPDNATSVLAGDPLAALAALSPLGSPQGRRGNKNESPWPDNFGFSSIAESPLRSVQVSPVRGGKDTRRRKDKNLDTFAKKGSQAAHTSGAIGVFPSISEDR
mmetsp:Transcript_51876/g.83797  ORF Transcript_51876/g.83797 Transcript_51876/m.83797 type:complete len:323 (+) Transcript_51876:135-1103(+)